MACSHENLPGYTFCAVCGERLAVRHCSCGFTCQTTDRHCGQCGSVLDQKAVSEQTSVQVNRGHRYNLNLVQDVVARNTSTLSDKPHSVDQDDVRNMIAALKKAGQ